MLLLTITLYFVFNVLHFYYLLSNNDNIFIIIFRNKVPPRPAGQRTEPDANTVCYD